MRISDWSSDVCSSDLRDGAAQQFAAPARLGLGDLRRGAAFASARLSRSDVPRSGLGAGRYGAARAVSRGRRAFRETLPRDAALDAADRGRSARDRTSGVSAKRVTVRVAHGGDRIPKKTTNTKNSKQIKKKPNK